MQDVSLRTTRVHHVAQQVPLSEFKGVDVVFLQSL